VERWETSGNNYRNNNGKGRDPGVLCVRARTHPPLLEE
jgi:hypothetical protein